MIVKKICGYMITIVLLFVISYGIVLGMNEKPLQVNLNISNQDKLLRNYGIYTLAKEVSSEYEDEMLKTQAVLVRTTLYKKVQDEGTEFLKEVEIEVDYLLQRRLENAWDGTEGQVVLYNDQLALVPFHQVSNGKTRNGAEVLETEEYPYLKSIECPMDVNAENQITNIFINETNVFVEAWDSAGYVTSVSIGDEKMSGENFREMYGLYSSCFEVQEFENQTRIITKGVGHGLGLSQHTANEMAKEGNSFQEILYFFFPGIEIREVAEILWDTE